MTQNSLLATDRMQRWRLVLGDAAQDSCAAALSAELLRADAALEALYDAPRAGGLGASCPNGGALVG